MPHTTTTPAGTTPARRPLSSTRLGLTAVLLFDAVTCVAMGAVLLAATASLALWLGLPHALLTAAGVLLLACAVPMAAAGLQRPPAGWLVMLVVVGNVAWALASGYVAWAVPGVTTLGQAFVIAQALAVLVLARLEWNGLQAGAA